MNLFCPICSELQLKTENIISTQCGHIFHRNCLENWLKTSSRSCPTCRTATNSHNLIKLFFEVDDNKGALNFDEILKTNDEISKEMKLLKDEKAKQQQKILNLEQELKDNAEKIKKYERQKQLDDMALAGLKSIRKDSQEQIVKLNEAIKILKLDLLGEKQLRRMHQERLHYLDPSNDNYNTACIDVDKKTLEIASKINLNNQSSSLATTSNLNKADVSSFQISPEAQEPKADFKKSPPLNFIIPSKIQKGSNKDNSSSSASNGFGSSRQQNHQQILKRPCIQMNKKPTGFSYNTSSQQPIAGFNFNFDNSQNSPQPQPSTSTNTLPNKTQNRTFGEKGTFSQPIKLPNSTGDNISCIGFNLSHDVPTFTSACSSPSTFLSTALNDSLRPFNFSSSNNSSGSYRMLNGHGPKSSDR
ncbi:CLUMA_CG009668, isoform A [Clunio marinus]|uniref:CLUMA_CG009668, isoform A n=1 Tax=Clunio marinus TaxID=568069 RepID=A0A1J1ICS3_9DIPT|nr:CLUMA_CG009668, isoform A [Clunio marinus]